ncbi:MAG TPA: tetratricopeptide repeat protein [Myxococcota bacterium]|nr:tetratricopeptide repeat protein [Myxococcota bacterium]
MEAIISGQAGVALLLLGEERFASIHAGETDVLIPRSRGDFPFLFGGAGDLQFLEDASHADVIERFQIVQKQADALHLTLILLDPELSNEVRNDAADDLEDLYGLREILEHVECVLFARPLPLSADLVGALNLTDHDSFPRLRPFLLRLRDVQGIIRQVYSTWEQIAGGAFDAADPAREFAGAMVPEGVFRDLVLALLNGTPIADVYLRVMINPHLTRLSNRRRILTDWFTRFSDLDEDSLPRSEEEGEERLADHEWDTRKAAEKRRSAHHRGIDREDVRSKIESQKTAIVALMRKSNLALTRKRIEELIAYQKTRGETVFICKSLCDLAQQAKDLGLHSLQLELTQRSIEEKPDDGWSWSQHADALLRNGRPREALVAYDQAEGFAGGVVTRNGRAETLRAMNRLDEALAAYDEAIRDFPEDVVARNGRAETFRAMNRLDEALDAYDQAIRDFPADIFARSGRAETLRAMNRLDEALAAYNEASRAFPGDVVARNGRAETLRAMNRLDEALDAYNEAIRAFPDNVVARNGRAETLRAMNRLDEALDAYDEAIRDLPNSVVTRSGRAETLRAMNRLGEALDAYDEAIRDFPAEVVARNGRAWVLALLGRTHEALESLPVSFPVTAQDWIGFHMRGMIQLRRGDADTAIQTFQKGIELDANPSQRDFFCSALAVAQLRKKQYQMAREVIASIARPSLQVEVNLLNLHAFGALGDQNRAREAYELLSRRAPPQTLELAGELQRRYIFRLAPRHDDDWVLQAELECVRQAA